MPVDEMQSPGPKRPYWDPFEEFTHEASWEGGREEAISEEDEYRPRRNKRKDAWAWPVDAEMASDIDVLGEE